MAIGLASASLGLVKRGRGMDVDLQVVAALAFIASWAWPGRAGQISEDCQYGCCRDIDEQAGEAAGLFRRAPA